MQCLILAGGLGTRMRPLTEGLPKVLLPVAGRPFAAWQLDWLKRGGVGRVVFAVGHQGQMIRDAIGRGERFGVEIAYSDEGDRLLGTAGAVRLAVDAGLMEERFFVLYGDSYLDLDLQAMARAAAGDERPLLAVFKNDGRWDASNAQVENGMVARFAKGLPDPGAAGLNYIDYGIALVTRGLIKEAVPPGGWCDLAELYAGLAAAGRLRAFEASERFYEIGSPAGLAALEAHLAEIRGAKAH
jgi:NDP-sugar pyrophosphorylase family protein